MPTSSPKTYSLIGVILVLVILALGYMFMSNIWPHYQLAQAENQRATVKNSDIKEAIASVQTFLDTYKSQKANSKLTNQALPSKNSDLPNFISSVAQLAQNSGIALSDFQVEQGVDSKLGTVNSIQVQNLSMGAAGNYLAFKDFLNSLELHLRLLDVTRVTLTVDSSTSAASSLKYNLQIQTYYQQ